VAVAMAAVVAVAVTGGNCGCGHWGVCGSDGRCGRECSLGLLWLRAPWMQGLLGQQLW